MYFSTLFYGTVVIVDWIVVNQAHSFYNTDLFLSSILSDSIPFAPVGFPLFYLKQRLMVFYLWKRFKFPVLTPLKTETLVIWLCTMY
jgi:hypothetical protein